MKILSSKKTNLVLPALMLLLSGVAHGAFSQKSNAQSVSEKAAGYVYHDKNGNERKDKTEPGIAGVAVSNGRKVVTTGGDGSYSLPVSHDTPLFVIKPSGWQTPVNANQLPRFYYLHKPNGSPEDFAFGGVKPTGKLPQSVNFPLYKIQEKDPFKMVVLGDPQPYTIREVDYFAEDIVQELIGRQDLDMGMTMGDIVGDDLELFSHMNEAVAQIGIPWYNVIGNHDINFQATHDSLVDETFERVYGPSTYAFVYGDVHFVVVNDVRKELKAGAKRYVGGLQPGQLQFVKNYLKTISKDQLVVLAMHIPLAKHGETFRASDQKKLFSLLRDFPHTLSISGHTHTQQHRFFHQDSTSWQQAQPHHHFNVGTTSGSWWSGMRGETDIPHTMMRDGTPNGYAFIRFKGVDYVIDWKVAGSPADHRMNIHFPRDVSVDAKDKPLLSVNYFNGSEETHVDYRILGVTNWRPMKKELTPDPYFVKLSKRWERFERLKFREHWQNDDELKDRPFPGRPLTDADPSTHLWQAALNADLSPGRHIIEVRVKDRHGRTFYENKTIRLAAAGAE